MIQWRYIFIVKRDIFIFNVLIYLFYQTICLCKNHRPIYLFDVILKYLFYNLHYGKINFLLGWISLVDIKRKWRRQGKPWFNLVNMLYFYGRHLGITFLFVRRRSVCLSVCLSHFQWAGAGETRAPRITPFLFVCADVVIWLRYNVSTALLLKLFSLWLAYW